MIATEACAVRLSDLFVPVPLRRNRRNTGRPKDCPSSGSAAPIPWFLLSSSVFVWFCERCVRRKRLRLGGGLDGGRRLCWGSCFVGIQLKEWHDHPYGPTTHLYGSLYFTITGFHLLHVLVGTRHSVAVVDAGPRSAISTTSDAPH